MTPAAGQPEPNQPQGTSSPQSPLFTGGSALAAREPRNWKPVGMAAGFIAAVVLALLLFGGHPEQQSNPGGAGLAPPAAYAASLPITDVKMSDSSSLSGGKETYLDGTVSNRGSKTVRGVTVQVAFKDVTGMLAAKNTLPLNLIRSREPYVDTEPVGAEPIQPGQSRPFRLIFDAVPVSWDGAYPEVRVIAVDAR